MVIALFTVIAPLYTAEDVVGVVPAGTGVGDAHLGHLTLGHGQLGSAVFQRHGVCSYPADVAPELRESKIYRVELCNDKYDGI